LLIQLTHDNFNFSIHFILKSARSLSFIPAKRVGFAKGSTSKRNARLVNQEFDFQHLKEVAEFAHARKILPRFRLSRDYSRCDLLSHANILASCRFWFDYQNYVINQPSLRAAWKTGCTWRWKTVVDKDTAIKTRTVTLIERFSVSSITRIDKDCFAAGDAHALSSFAFEKNQKILTSLQDETLFSSILYTEY